MSFSASFTIAQGQDPSIMSITDTSSYSSEVKASFSSRKINIYRADGTAVRFPSDASSDDINFSFAGFPTDKIEITGIEKDESLRVVMTLTPITPVGGSFYTLSSVVSLTGYIYTYLLNIGQIAALAPHRVNEYNFYEIWSSLQTEIDAAENAAIYGDQLSANACLSRATAIMNQSKISF